MGLRVGLLLLLLLLWWEVERGVLLGHSECGLLVLLVGRLGVGLLMLRLRLLLRLGLGLGVMGIRPTVVIRALVAWSTAATTTAATIRTSASTSTTAEA